MIIFGKTVLSVGQRLANRLMKSIDSCLFFFIRNPEMKIVESYHPWTRREGATETYNELRCALAGRGSNVDDHCLLIFANICNNDSRIRSEIEYLILSLKEPDDEPEDIALALREQSP